MTSQLFWLLESHFGFYNIFLLLLFDTTPAVLMSKNEPKDMLNGNKRSKVYAAFLFMYIQEFVRKNCAIGSVS